MKNIRRRALAGTALAAAVAGGAVLAASPAHADVHRSGTCAGARFELNVDRERRGFEIDAGIDGAVPGSAWRVTLRHDGAIVHRRVHRADEDGEIDVDARRRDTAGRDTFVLRVKPPGGRACSLRATLR